MPGSTSLGIVHTLVSVVVDATVFADAEAPGQHEIAGTIFVRPAAGVVLQVRRAGAPS